MVFMATEAYQNIGTEYRNRIYDLNLSDETLKKLELKFITNACHMIMLENPKQLYQSLETIWNHD